MWRFSKDHQMTPEDEEFNRIEREAKQRMEAVSAALDRMSENERELGIQMQPAIPDALTASDGESLEYMQGWNDCRAEMLRGRQD
jgi:hypothetical protein